MKKLLDCVKKAVFLLLINLFLNPPKITFAQQVQHSTTSKCKINMTNSFINNIIFYNSH